MNDFFADFRALPQEFVDLGALVPATLTRTSAGTFDKATLRKTGATTTTINGHGVLKTVETTASDGALVMTTTAKLTVEPKVNDSLTIGSTTATVTAVKAIAPDGNGFFWTAILS